MKKRFKRKANHLGNVDKQGTRGVPRVVMAHSAIFDKFQKSACDLVEQSRKLQEPNDPWSRVLRKIEMAQFLRVMKLVKYLKVLLKVFVQTGRLELLEAVQLEMG